MRTQGQRSTGTTHDSRKRAVTAPSPQAGQPSPLQRSLGAPHQASPATLLSLQRAVGNQAVVQLLQRHPTTTPHGGRQIQRTFDEECITNTINTQATSISFLGGTEGAYRVETSSDEHPRLVVKATNKEIPVFAGALAKQLGINTPDIISVSSAAIQEKAEQLSAKLGSALKKTERATVQEFITGDALDEKPNITSKTLGQIGNIASFDMMIGKQDLFNNYTQSFYKEDNEQNFKNILFKGSNAYDIDLDNGARGSLLEDKPTGSFGTQQQIIESILENPTKISPFITRNIGGLMEVGETGVSVQGINGLKIQRGMLETLVRTRDALEPKLGDMPEGGKYEPIKEMIAFYAKVAPAAENAIEEITLRIEELEEEARERERQREEERRHRQEERRLNTNTQPTKRTKPKKQPTKDNGCKCCIQ